MNPIEELSKYIELELPGVRATIDAPSKSTGEWFLDLDYEGHTVIVQWRQGEGFGISAPLVQPGLGEAADETELDADRAKARVLELLRNRSYSIPL
jgi:hypothetical protein